MQTRSKTGHSSARPPAGSERERQKIAFGRAAEKTKAERAHRYSSKEDTWTTPGKMIIINYISNSSRTHTHNSLRKKERKKEKGVITQWAAELSHSSATSLHHCSRRHGPTLQEKAADGRLHQWNYYRLILIRRRRNCLKRREKRSAPPPPPIGGCTFDGCWRKLYNPRSCMHSSSSSSSTRTHVFVIYLFGFRKRIRKNKNPVVCWWKVVPHWLK